MKKKRQQRYWTEEELRLLREAYEAGGKRLAQRVLREAGYERTKAAIGCAVHVHGIRTQYRVRFPKGHEPSNKGKKMSRHVYERARPTMFKPGHEPHNTRYNGAIQIRQKRGSKPYLYVRLGPKRWVELHRHLWKTLMGPIPPGHVIIFLNGNSLDCRLENLVCYPRRLHLLVNQARAGGHPGRQLSDNYVRGVLRTFHGIDDLVITPEIIEAKRLQLILKREIKNTNG